ncbi:MAG TPA: uracil-DNA glycosylase [Candidatus Baltobacteraceae bacterium]|nr:uracil-DNA glycosylase [Candidatus Baltobacteraceae bacterium]
MATMVSNRRTPSVEPAVPYAFGVPALKHAAMGTFDLIQQTVVQCTKCRELRTYCSQVAVEKKKAYRDWTYWGKPVPAFGDENARVMLVGLAPGAHGSNRTGRMFTGDASGDFLYPALYRAGFATQPSAVSADDGMELHDCIITAALRCAPPQNKPTPQQLRRCFPYLLREMEALQRVQVIVGLGAIGTKAAIDMLKDSGYNVEPQRWNFGHGVEILATKSKRRITVIASFHPSRQNTNTGKLTKQMFGTIFTRAKALLK